MTDNTVPLRVAAVHQRVTIFEVFELMGLEEPAETHQMRCPFHQDSHPSARVYADQNKLYCFTCQKTWDVIAAVQDHWHLAFSDALVWLEERFGLRGGGALDLTGQLRVTLTTQDLAPQLQTAAHDVEAVLMQYRAELGYHVYTRLLSALDLSVLEAGERRIRPREFYSRLQRILEVVNGLRDPGRGNPSASGAPSAHV